MFNPKTARNVFIGLTALHILAYLLPWSGRYDYGIEFFLAGIGAVVKGRLQFPQEFILFYCFFTPWLGFGVALFAFLRERYRWRMLVSNTFLLLVPAIGTAAMVFLENQRDFFLAKGYLVWLFTIVLAYLCYVIAWRNYRKGGGPKENDISKHLVDEN